MMDLKRLISEQGLHHNDLREDLHRIPETGFKEQKTSALIIIGVFLGVVRFVIAE